MRNTAAAIEAYRRALDINPRDYRAWYGLGQTYEILQMHFYSLYYFRKATALRPYAARMWSVPPSPPPHPPSPLIPLARALSFPLFFVYEVGGR